MSTDPTNQSAENSEKVSDEQEQEQKKVEEKPAAAENKVENQEEQEEEEEIDIDLNDEKVQETAVKMQNMFFKKKGFGKKKE